MIWVEKRCLRGYLIITFFKHKLKIWPRSPLLRFIFKQLCDFVKDLLDAKVREQKMFAKMTLFNLKTHQNFDPIHNLFWSESKVEKTQNQSTFNWHWRWNSPKVSQAAQFFWSGQNMIRARRQFYEISIVFLLFKNSKLTIHTLFLG